jgi:hypothetical protein
VVTPPHCPYKEEKRMQNLNFDDGFKKFSINGDENRVISFNPADFGIIERIKTAYDQIEKATNLKEDIDLKLDGTAADELGKAAEIVKGINDIIRNQIDYIFNSPVSETVFGNQSPLGLVKGIPLYERFMNAVIPVIKKEVENEMTASQKRIGKYTKQVPHK